MLELFSIGQVVYSKSGRDKGNPFVITRVEGKFLYLADGKVRKLSSPKKKKDIHVQKTNVHFAEIKAALEQGWDKSGRLVDADLRKALAELES
ncbi:MAG: KOW domain-containing RNA-binding protein [Defluviitaleaceae bacterium]|nr:KOW domain-containing RNA-binding protein [Defluviitaleaceae bacterium]